MFRFRTHNPPPAPPAPNGSRAKRWAAAAARGTLLGAAAAAKASADALRWAAEGRPAPPAPPKVEPTPVVFMSPPPVMAGRPLRPLAPPAKSSSKVLPILAVALVVGVVVSLTGLKSDRRETAAPPEPRNMARLSPAKLTDYAADNGVLGGAKAALAALEKQAKAKLMQGPPAPTVVQLPPIPPVAPEPPAADRSMRMAFHLTPEDAPKPKSAVRLDKVKSAAPHTTRDAALADALLVAQGRLAEQFGKLDPPLDLTPGLKEVRTFLKDESVAEVRPTAADRAALEAFELGDRFWVTADFEVTDGQVRQLRGDHRLAVNAPLFLLPLLLAGGLWGFLRLDALSKGHLTGWLVAGVGGLVILAAACAALARPW